MKFKAIAFYFLLSIIFIISSGTLACHIAQHVLLSKESDIESWWPHYIPYIFFYVGSIVSILSTLIIIVTHRFYQRHLGLARIIAVINLSLTIAFIVYISLKSYNVPYTGRIEPNGRKGFATYCSLYITKRSYIRCWLVNGSWLGTVIYGGFWLIFLIYCLFLRYEDFSNENYDGFKFVNGLATKEKTTLPDPNAGFQDQQHPNPSQESFYFSKNTPTPKGTTDPGDYYNPSQIEITPTPNEISSTKIYLENISEGSTTRTS